MNGYMITILKKMCIMCNINVQLLQNVSCSYILFKVESNKRRASHSKLSDRKGIIMYTMGSNFGDSDSKRIIVIVTVSSVTLFVLITRRLKVTA